jgi:hypothetical protein
LVLGSPLPPPGVPLPTPVPPSTDEGMVELHIRVLPDVAEYRLSTPRIAIPEIPPSGVSCCEANVAASPARCTDCVPGLFVCRAHLVECRGECFICCNFCLKVLCFTHMYCPCADAVARREWVASLPPVFPVHSVAPTVLQTPSSCPVFQAVLPLVSSVPVVQPSSLPVILPSAVPTPVPCLPDPSVGSPIPCVRVSSVLSPGPTYDGPEPDPALMIWPLSECPDWPINDSWRDFAFLPVVFSPREQSDNENNSVSDCDCP